MLTFMKLRIPTSFLALLLLTSPLVGESTGAEQRVIPEVSEPPYAVGDHATIQGYYIALDEGISLNFRLVNNKARLYWVDADDLVVEPQSTGGSLRFRGSVRGAAYHALTAQSNEAALGSTSGLVLSPHIFNVILNLKPLKGDGLNSYTFRYLPTMDVPRESRELSVSSTD
jgi:hypothetical protein